MAHGRVNILLVEDNDLDVRRMERGFRKLDDDRCIVRARDGVEALQILRGEVDILPPPPPYVIVLDLNLPRMSGLDFLRALRRDAAHRTLPVFIVTTSDFHIDIKTAHDGMINGYLLKPDSADQMVSVLKTLSDYWDCCVYAA